MKYQKKYLKAVNVTKIYLTKEETEIYGQICYLEGQLSIMANTATNFISRLELILQLEEIFKKQKIKLPK